jgi:hypothetical protein
MTQNRKEPRTQPAHSQKTKKAAPAMPARPRLSAAARRRMDERMTWRVGDLTLLAKRS